MKPIPPTEQPPWFQPWVPGWKRKLALPVYKFWLVDELPPWEPGKPDEFGNVCAGRMVLWGDAKHRQWDHKERGWMQGMRDEIERNFAMVADGREELRAEIDRLREEMRVVYRAEWQPIEPIPRESVANICETDIVYLPYYAGVDDPQRPPLGRGNGVDDLLPDEVAGPNREALQEFAPRCKAVLIGNLYSEMAWADYESPTSRCAFEWWQTEVRHWRFMESAAEMIREAGGRPAFAPVPMEIQMDAFEKPFTGRISRFFQDLDALFISFNLDTLITDFHAEAMRVDPDGWRRRYPYSQFREYFGPLDCIGGCDWGRILSDDWDQILADHGVKAIC